MARTMEASRQFHDAEVVALVRRLRLVADSKAVADEKRRSLRQFDVTGTHWIEIKFGDSDLTHDANRLIHATRLCPTVPLALAG